MVESANGITVKADILFDEVNDFSDADILMLPGGMPGAANLNLHEGLRKLLVKQNEMVNVWEQFVLLLWC